MGLSDKVDFKWLMSIKHLSFGTWNRKWGGLVDEIIEIEIGLLRSWSQDYIVLYVLPG